MQMNIHGKFDKQQEKVFLIMIKGGETLEKFHSSIDTISGGMYVLSLQ